LLFLGLAASWSRLKHWILPMAGAPNPEMDENPIEVTPDMEIAGARVLCDHYPEETGPFSVDRLIAHDVFLAMWRASLK
jgi:hypothetical protein